MSPAHESFMHAIFYYKRRKINLTGLDKGASHRWPVFPETYFSSRSPLSNRRRHWLQPNEQKARARIGEDPRAASWCYLANKGNPSSGFTTPSREIRGISPRWLPDEDLTVLIWTNKPTYPLLNLRSDLRMSHTILGFVLSFKASKSFPSSEKNPTASGG